MKDACVRTGATLRIINIPLPILSPESVILSVIKELNFNTKLIILDQITSNTAMILPIADISILCKQFGAIVLIDAAHSMFSQDCSIYTRDQEIFSSELSERLPQEKKLKTNPENNQDNQKNQKNVKNSLIKTVKNKIRISDFADIWITNSHKWMCCPKGCAFMWVSPRMSERLRPAIISHGYISNENSLICSQSESESFDFSYIDYLNQASKSNNNDNSTNILSSCGVSNDSNNNSSNRIKNSYNSNSKYLGHYVAANKLLSSYAWDGCRDYSALLTMPSAIAIWGKIAQKINFDDINNGGGGGSGSDNYGINNSYKISNSNSNSNDIDESLNNDNSTRSDNNKRYKSKIDLSVIRNHNKNLLNNATHTLSREWGVTEYDFAAPECMREGSPMSLVRSLNAVFCFDFLCFVLFYFVLFCQLILFCYYCI